MDFSPILVFLITMVLAMLPIIEIRGALPVGMSVALWGTGALSPALSWLASLLGGIIACFIAVLVFLPFRKFLSRYKIFQKVFTHCDKSVQDWVEKFSQQQLKRKNKKEKKLDKTVINNPTIIENKQIEFTPQTKVENVQQKPAKKRDKATFLKSAIVFIFCALPIPFSGVWSAGALCSILKLSFTPSVIVLILANILSSVVVGFFCIMFAEFIDLVLVVMVLLMLFVFIYSVLAYVLNRKSKNQQQ